MAGLKKEVVSSEPNPSSVEEVDAVGGGDTLPTGDGTISGIVV